jgi:hypothetical protein
MRDGESLKRLRINFSAYFIFVIILGNMPNKKDFGRNGREEESADGLARRDA